jgi:predicted Kef-type K+ transport protein
LTFLLLSDELSDFGDLLFLVGQLGLQFALLLQQGVGLLLLYAVASP